MRSRGVQAVVTAMAMLVVTSVDAIYTGLPLGPQGYVWGSASTLTQPPILTSSGGVLSLTLTVDMMVVNTGIMNFTTRGYYYTNTLAAQGPVVTLAASWPGPTLKVKPGDKLVIKLVNNLGANPTALSAICCGLPTSMPNGMYPTPNTTNLHFHGLASNPDEDSIFIHVAPGGGSFTYTVNIPAYHAPGSHWYHAHVHGSVALQVMGGLVGALYVEPSTSSVLPAEVTAMTRYTMMLQHVSQTTANPFTDPFTVRTYPTLATTAGDTTNPNFAWTSGLTYKDVYLINGRFQPKLSVAQYAWTLFDLINGVGDHVPEIEVRTAVMGGTAACELYVLAYDGVYLNTAPRYASFVPMIPGQRASVALRCNTTGTFYMQTWGGNTEAGHSDVADTEVKFNQLLMTITVTTSTTKMSLPATLATITRPWYLTSLLTATVNAVWQEGVDQTGPARDSYWLGMGPNCTGECGGRGGCTITNANSSTCGYSTFAGTSRASTGVFRHITRMGNVNQLVIQGRGKTPHPMHLHTMHVQLQADLTKGLWGLAGDWRDVLPAVSGSTVVRYPAFFAGEIVVHCHFLFHEDHGMMDTIWVQSNATTSPFTSCTYPSTCSVTASPAPPSPPRPPPPLPPSPPPRPPPPSPPPKPPPPPSPKPPPSPPPRPPPPPSPKPPPSPPPRPPPPPSPKPPPSPPPRPPPPSPKPSPPLAG